ncbi:integrase core domain-containing protein [Streptomyces sioyaensis]|uniref:integrase core domain-containing protein n=1 Tax=Streptomyces sioyaensis TaxID=67364 RepID=UPI0036E9C02F
MLTDSPWAYTKNTWRQTCRALGISPRWTRLWRPQTNGKVERLNRTLLEKWAYFRPYTSNTERTKALNSFLHTYRRWCHTTLGGQSPISCVNSAAGQHTWRAMRWRCHACGAIDAKGCWPL